MEFNEDKILMAEECEHDCKHICIGCDKSFCEIKSEYDLSHQEEMIESMRTNAGDHFCHPDCFEAYWS
jgi:hypothetical protein